MGKVMRCRSTLSEEIIEEIITEDGILCLIVSLLPLREAARTSVLSRRWRHIWTNRRDFMFDAATMHDDPNLLSKLRLMRQDKRELFTDKFIQSVNLVLLQHEGRATNEIVVEFLLHKAHYHLVDAWVRFAVASKIKKLSLFLEHQYSDLPIEPYDFPCYMIESSSPLQELSLNYCCLKPTNNFGGFNHLTELLLDMPEEDINNLVSNCSVLKKFSLRWAQHLVTLSIPRPLSQLESVSIDYCDMLKKIEINAVNLVEIHYIGFPVDFVFRQSSKLKVAHIWFDVVGMTLNLDFYLTQLSKNLPLLNSLIFKISGFSEVIDLPKSSNRFMHLTHLDWQWDIGAKMSYFRLATLLDAAPFLQKLKLAGPQSNFPGPNSLCTACVVLVENNKSIAANVGDSRCYLSRKGQAMSLSTEHRPELQVESDRIFKAGGFIKAGRVNGILNISRAIGGFRFKQNMHMTPENQVLSAYPDITVVHLSEDDCFCVLACDAVWDCMSSQQLVDFIGEHLETISSEYFFLGNCSFLEACLSAGVRSDNMIMIPHMNLFN